MHFDAILGIFNWEMKRAYYVKLKGKMKEIVDLTPSLTINVC